MTKSLPAFAPVLLSIILLLASSTGAQQNSEDLLAHELMNNYLDLIRSGNLESALGLWEPKALEQAQRLNIRFENIPIKPDCNSPVMYDYDRVKEFFYNAIQSLAVIDSLAGIRRLRFSLLLGAEKIEYHYYARKIGQNYWLIFPHDYYAENWPVKESKYFRIHINPQQLKYYNERAAARLDDFVEKTAARLGLPPESLRYLATAKMEYYLCQSEQEVAVLSNGPAAKGVYHLPSDAIISMVFPHYHEVAHLLVNYKLQEIPLYTASFLQEGLAVYLGGRWQRSAEVMIDFGKYILDQGIVELDSVLLENDSLSEVSSDIAYPVAATLNDYLLSAYSPDKFWQLYHSLSGDRKFIRALTVDKVKEAIQAVLGQDWVQFDAAFRKFLAERKSRGGMISPGALAGGKTIFNGDSVMVAIAGKSLQVEAVADSAGKVDFSLLFGFDSTMAGKVSSIFEEHFPLGKSFEGYRFGVRMDKNEAGLYDYFGNQLLAKYVYDFDPSPEYFNRTANRFAVHFDLKLLDGFLPDGTDFKVMR
jgi:hypothetical protein